MSKEIGYPDWESPDPKACYDFNLFGVWIIDGVAYWASDSGCSCPSPFENYNKVEDLERSDYVGIMKAYEEHVDWYNHPDVLVARVELAMLLTKEGI